MSLKINMTRFAGKKLLIAPLDWGLGHATRCIPIIKDLIANNCNIWLAGEGAQEKLLRKEFPDLSFLPLKGYNIRFPGSGAAVKILFRVPKILRTIKDENTWLKEQVTKYDFDGVISDNRYGLYHDKIFSVFITHQLTIKSPFGKWSESILQQWNYKFINRFNECWVPDEEGKDNLAGDLSHPEKLPGIPIKYIGALSRFVPKDSYGESIEGEEIKNHLLIILSGPEPQRSLLEEIIINEIAHYNGSATIVRGLPNEESIIPSTNTICFHNHLDSKSLNDEMNKASFVISRSGYSTIMDIIKLKKKSILIPTPGQSEQEYLANYLSGKQIVFCVPQKDFSLQKALNGANNFTFRFTDKTN